MFRCKFQRIKETLVTLVTAAAKSNMTRPQTVAFPLSFRDYRFQIDHNLLGGLPAPRTLCMHKITGCKVSHLSINNTLRYSTTTINYSNKRLAIPRGQPVACGTVCVKSPVLATVLSGSQYGTTLFKSMINHKSLVGRDATSSASRSNFYSLTFTPGPRPPCTATCQS